MAGKPKAKGLMERQPPFQLPETSLREARAFQALAKGDAGEDQQIRLYRYLTKKLGMVGQLSLFQGQPDVTAFNNGRQFCGLNIIHLAETPMDVLRKTCLTLTKQEIEDNE
jgi:hypothetical protein